MFLRRVFFCLILAFGFGLPTFAQESVSPKISIVEFSNGRWFNGREFEARTMYSVNGWLQTERPTRIDSKLDLNDGFVIPPLGEAHTHRPTTPNRFQNASARFIRDGVFYLMNHGNLARYHTEFSKQASRPETVDGQFSGALIASPQSHGVELWQRIADRGSIPGVKPDSLAGDAYFVIDGEASLRKKWPEYLQTKPDFVKIMVEYSEEYFTRSKDKSYFGKSGLHPKLVPPIVKLAHQSGLRVSAHIETAADFHVVVDAGVDVVAHLPGYDLRQDEPEKRYRIDPADAAKAKKQNTVVITTTLLGVDRANNDKRRLQKILKLQKHNLQLLSKAGVRLAIGSDQFSTNAADELQNLASLGIFDNKTLIEMACNTSAKTIFPKRKIGSLEEGYEASFLVLKDNPITNLKHLRQIELRVKKGVVLAASGNESFQLGK